MAEAPTRLLILRGQVRWFGSGGGVVHRTDGPAIERPDGYRTWNQNGQLHRLDGPAMELPNGTRYWYQNGNRHRLDGPAIEYTTGDVEYWINGVEYPQAKFIELASKRLSEKKFQ